MSLQYWPLIDSEDQIKAHIKDGQKHMYTILLVPRVSTLVNRILEEEGVLGEVNVSAFNLQFIPIADDVVSLENENAFKEVHLVSIRAKLMTPILI